MIRRLLFTACVAASFYSIGFSQDKFHVFPQIADGRFTDGTSYRSTFMILPWFASDHPDCTLRFYGLTVTFSTNTSNIFNFTIPSGSFLAQTTNGAQLLKSGYATLNCTDYVFAQVLYTFYAPDGSKLSEATVFSSAGNFNFKLILDQRAGSRLGIAVANNNDATVRYGISFGGTSTSFSVPARTSIAKFADEIISIPANAVGILQIQSQDYSDFSMIGLRFTGQVFTTIPAN